MFLMGIVPLLIIGLLVWLVIEGTRRREDRVLPNTGSLYSASQLDAAPRRDARLLLDERYARGEIDRDEYFQRREDLAR